MFDYTACNRVPIPSPPAGISSWSYDSTNNICTIVFPVEETMKAPVFLYYRLTNFYQNHRRYVKSLSAPQLKGVDVAKNSLGDCAPLIGPDNSDLIYYPCGLIANSFFNGKI